MPTTINASVAGQMRQRLVAAGETITPDTEVAIIEAMKMHIPVVAEAGGTVARWLVEEGATVKEGQPLIALEA